MNDKSSILNYLKKNELGNVNIINFIENYPIHYIERIGDSILVKGTSDRDWVYISSNSMEELKIIRSKLNHCDKNFAIIEDWMIPILIEENNVKWKLPTLRLILPSDIDLPLPNPSNNISQLRIEDASFIYENSHYKEYVSIEYIAQRISNGISSCLRVHDKPVAWAATQDDGAIGFLIVLPEYRRKGYGRNVLVDLIYKVSAARKIPFVHIEETNEKSMNLATSLGFKRERIVSWFEIE